MATHSSILAWQIPWTEESGELQSRGLERVRHTLATKEQFCLSFCNFFFSHLPVGLSDLNFFQMSFILLWGGEGD